MKKAAIYNLLPLLLFFVITACPSGVSSLDNPHNVYKTINCGNCHVTDPDAIWWTDQGGEQSGSKGVCRSCHTSGGLGPYVSTHSSAAVSSVKYGTWDNKCTVCHNPHTQRQFRAWKSESYVSTGLSTGVTSDTLTKAGAGWTVNQWAGYILLPNVLYQNLHYRILSNTSDTITIDTGNGGIDVINQAYIRPGQTFGISYGMLVKDYVGGRAVKFFNNTGAKSFADGDTTRDGVCEACHTKTQGTGGAARYRNTAHEDSHFEAQRCTECHRHEDGFRGSCTVCHGNPPLDNATLVFFPGTTGSTTAGAHSRHATGGVNYPYACGTCHFNGMPVTATSGNNRIQIGFNLFGGTIDGTGTTYKGQAVNAPYSYEYTNGTTEGVTTFQCTNVYCHGNYPGSGLNAVPSWDNAASGSCGTCHGASKALPPASGNHVRHAGTGSTLSTGNREFPCTLCHSGIIGITGPDSYATTDTAKHANRTIDWLFDTSDWRLSAAPVYSIASGMQAPSDGTAPRAYGTCTNVYCHSNVQPDGGIGAPAYDTPRWGDTTGGWGSTCSACHNSGGHLEIYTGGHQSHIQDYYFGYSSASTARKCTLCHKYNAAAAYSSCNAHCHTSPDEVIRHADGNVDIRFDTAKAGVSASYDGSPAPGDGYGNCSNTYCHSSGSSVSTGSAPTHAAVNWGSGPIVCDSCHGFGPSYTTGFPKANSHVKHVTDRGITCDKCHWLTTRTGSSITDYAAHVNITYDVVNSAGSLTYTFNTAGGSCSGAFGCHGDATWGGTIPAQSYADCVSCHKTVMNSRRQIVDSNADGTGAGGDFIKTSHHHYGASVTITNADCQVCHDTSRHPGGSIRLKNADTGEVYVYNAANPSTAENHCLSCHDADGANGNMSPFTDGKTLGLIPYRASIDVKSNWNKTYGHRQKGLTCLGNGNPNTGCHANGHGSDYAGLLARNLTLPNNKANPYTAADAGDYELCFTCHASYPGKTKEDILGVKQGGKYDNDHGWFGTVPPYYISAIITKFRDRYDNSGKTYDDDIGWRSPGTYYNLHYYHLEEGSGWDYRGSIASNTNCITCHSVHGSDTQWGWVHDQIQFGHYSGAGSDQYGAINNIGAMDVYPVNCAFNCHSVVSTFQWFEPSGE